ncbi:SGNH/GDSL hydrolase family protein [[Flexibacter] sp. ATCC 35208]|uniref:SGNH/GDSL hydrolase family protein n=1 Tax=[Flexibacter] sp. ATCC 35208 TaxID=1936242 RepID=UPI0009FB110B|nr:SGNH/GDSL hydrolase family protein [[Flexibacter] sp. ATCC 35208]
MKNSRIPKLALLAIISLICGKAHAQKDTSWHWYIPAQIEGQAFSVATKYDRLPAKAAQTVPSKVWNLSRMSAGLSVRFRTSAPDIVVRYVVTGKLDMPHMPATGASGVDLYSIDPNGAWKWSAGKYNFGDTVTYRFSGMSKDAGEYRLYLPLYNTVKWLEIGTVGSDSVHFLPLRPEKPIVVYGTSIAQGACASRPGLAWTNQLDRMMDRPVINLGFAGNGKLDPPVTELLTEIDAKVYVLDCLPNISGLSYEEIFAKVLAAVEQLRKVKPNTPVLLVEHGRIGGNDALENAYYSLQDKGVKQLYLLPVEQLGLGIESTVDGTHPNDIGMQQYANAYAQILRQIFHEPIGNINTTIPCRQYRELIRYDWDLRHNTLLAMNKKNPPKVVIIGNSITHFWGGEPAGPIARGTDSWPKGARNMGFGWDRVENVLWRVYHDELDGFEARKIVIMIGTNNLQMNTDAEIIAGLQQLVIAIKERQPKADILLAGILPRVDMADRVAKINKGIQQMAGMQQVLFINPGQVLLNTDLKPDSTLFTDGLHPNSTGYSQLADYLRRYLQ